MLYFADGATILTAEVLIGLDESSETDLISALKSSEIAGAALDVRISEPPTSGELETLENLILTPHIAGITKESQAAINKILVDNIDLVLNGEKATHAVGANS